MKKNIRISVAMATYNGEKFIKEQIDSILKNLSDDDEIVISDDGSTDNTLKIINSIKDKRIKIFEGPRAGVKKNFENAINKSNGMYIFLSDQDDIWSPNKVKTILKAFNDNNCTCIVHDCAVVDEQMKNIIYDSFFEYRKSKNGVVSNIIKNSYIGCCMAFKAELKAIILPIPNAIEMHDQWIGILSDMNGKSVFIRDNLLKYRRHNSNTSSLKHYGILKMLRNRLVLIFYLLFKKGRK